MFLFINYCIIDICTRFFLILSSLGILHILYFLIVYVTFIKPNKSIIQLLKIKFVT